MMLVNISLVFSGILFFLSVGLLIFGSYISYKEFNNLKSDTEPVKLLTKYHWSAIIGIGLSAFILFAVVIGLSWESFGFSAALAIAALGFSSLDNFIRLKTTRFLNRKK
jgi:hypothetical protein